MRRCLGIFRAKRWFLKVEHNIKMYLILTEIWFIRYNSRLYIWWKSIDFDQSQIKSYLLSIINWSTLQNEIWIKIFDQTFNHSIQIIYTSLISRSSRIDVHYFNFERTTYDEGLRLYRSRDQGTRISIMQCLLRFEVLAKTNTLWRALQ